MDLSDMWITYCSSNLETKTNEWRHCARHKLHSHDSVVQLGNTSTRCVKHQAHCPENATMPTTKIHQIHTKYTANEYMSKPVLYVERNGPDRGSTPVQPANGGRRHAYSANSCKQPDIMTRPSSVVYDRRHAPPSGAFPPHARAARGLISGSACGTKDGHDSTKDARALFSDRRNNRDESAVATEV